MHEVKAYGVENAERYVEFRVKPSFRSLGQRGLGKEAQLLKKTMATLSSADAGALASKLMAGGTVMVEGVDLKRDDVEVEFVAKEGFAAAGDQQAVVVLDTRLDDELRDLGLLRELLNRVQTVRKELDLEYADRIRLWVTGGERVVRVIREHTATLASEVLAIAVSTDAAPQGTEVREMDVEGEPVVVGISRASVT